MFVTYKNSPNSNFNFN